MSSRYHICQRHVFAFTKERVSVHDHSDFVFFQSKYKEYRNIRRASLKTTHRHVLEIVSHILNTEPPQLEEGLIDKDEYIQSFDSFFTDHGKHALVICWQPMTPPPFGMCLYFIILFCIFLLKR